MKGRSSLKVKNQRESRVMMLVSLLAGMALKRQSYCFQLFKQFVLFPDESESSERTVSKFDRLIFSDLELHTIFKKLETKLIQNKIWAYMNLANYRYIQAAKTINQRIKHIKKRVQSEQKNFSFCCIKKQAFKEVLNTNQSNKYSLRNKQKGISSYTHIKITETKVTDQYITFGAPQRIARINDDQRYRLEGSRSRSGSVTRYQYVVDNGKRIQPNSKTPFRLSITKNQVPLISEKVTIQGDHQQALQNVTVFRQGAGQNERLRMEYGNDPKSNKLINQSSKSRSRIISIKRSELHSKDRPECPNCKIVHSTSTCCNSPKKITRLSSVKKKIVSESYLQHFCS